MITIIHECFLESSRCVYKTLFFPSRCISVPYNDANNQKVAASLGFMMPLVV